MREPLRIDRRQALGWLGAAGAAAFLPGTGLAATAGDPDLYAAAAKLPDGRFAALVLDGAGLVRRELALPDRGHDFAHHAPTGLTVAFARRPGTFALAFRPMGAGEPTLFAAPADRHFYGHGAFSADGRLLYATENAFDDGGRGTIGIYEVESGFRRVGEHPAGGIGPHETLLLEDGRTLAIANGGILTHPDFPRAKLNPDTMRPNLAYLDTVTGRIVETRELSRHLARLSIRHMTASAGETLWFGCQWEGDAGDEVALVGRHRRGRDLELLGAPATVWRGFRNYVGSVATGADGRLVATSSPRGGTITLWDAASGNALHQLAWADASGVAGAPTGILASDGGGQAGVATTEGRTILARTDRRFDNHLRQLA